MVAIRCSECGERVLIPPEAIGLWKRPDGCNLLRFTCPTCGLGSEGCLGDDGLELLRSDGVTAIDVPAEALEDHDGPPLTLDDLIDLHFLLESGDWGDRFARTTARRWKRRLTRAPGKRRAAA